MNQALTFVDTNILIYAHDTHDLDKHRTAVSIVTDLWETDTGALSTQVLQEFYNASTKKLKKPLSRWEARERVANYSEWRTVETDALLIVSASKLEEDHTLAFYDALIVEAALRSGATKLLTEDMQHGRRFGNLLIENPFRP
ncbi:PIN domain-containing protein [Saccharopolyspora sp. ASAGF58]|uniref:PIN domain-containing protein n=1 Tax=Saccharopolyspora sp. ASAGF58 TaxID=2719023 RepID=UPI0014449F13|nr:PIN domain-containing protein [Saccharopolyspora sp. ASAGF58]